MILTPFFAHTQIKIGDFGISKILERTRDRAYSKVGTPAYMAPEILAHKSYDTKADMWSLGCILYELTTLTAPNFQASDASVFLSCDSGWFTGSRVVLHTLLLHTHSSPLLRMFSNTCP